MTNINQTVEDLAREYDERSPQDILRHALENYEDIAISFSGAEDVVLVDMASKIRAPVKVFSLDTGRLHAETYRFIDKVRDHYGDKIQLDIMFPDSAEVENLVRSKGLFSFFEDGHKECCGIRKVAPLRRRLTGLDAWITGQRRDQSHGTRDNVPVAQLDPAFGSADKPLVKFNPLAHWTSAQVWEYIRMFDVPYNELHEKGFISIGCEPCTRPVLPNQHEREGRWWWEDTGAKECGLHVGASNDDRG